MNSKALVIFMSNIVFSVKKSSIFLKKREFTTSSQFSIESRVKLPMKLFQLTEISSLFVPI